MTNSISILSNAIHDFCDSFSIGISFLLEKKNKINSDKINTYNYLKYSLLGAIVTSVVLIFGSGIIIFNSIPRVAIHKVIQDHTTNMMKENALTNRSEFRYLSTFSQMVVSRDTTRSSGAKGLAAPCQCRCPHRRCTRCSCRN